jgi:hypothetical protein
MKHATVVKMLALFVMISTVCALGCAHTMSSESTRIRQASWGAELDDCREVRLSLNRVFDKEDGEPDRAYEQLILEVRPRPHLEFESLLKSVELNPGGRGGETDFGELEVRADEERRKVWFVDRATGQVVATLDRDTEVTTGPDDETPAWATPDGGILLED